MKHTDGMRPRAGNVPDPAVKAVRPDHFHDTTMAGTHKQFLTSVFTEEVAATYERINRLLTFGMDSFWRRKAVRTAVSAAPAGTWIDICTGTGETAMLLTEAAPAGTEIFAVDMSLPMLLRARMNPRFKGARVTASDASSLCFKSSSTQLITISFALRNLNHGRSGLLRIFNECQRVLRPGGHLVTLETSQPASPILQKLFHAYVNTAVEPVGKRLSGSETAYAYLAHTIPRFHNAEKLANIMREAGFTPVTYQRLFPGIVAIHHGVNTGCGLQRASQRLPE